MKVNIISYSRSYEMVNPTGLKYWEKIGLEAELEETETQMGLLALKEQVEKFHKENQVPLSFVADNKPVEVVQIKSKAQSKKAMIEGLVNDILACTTLDKDKNGLLTFEALVATIPELKETYNKQFKKIQDGL